MEEAYSRPPRASVHEFIDGEPSGRTETDSYSEPPGATTIEDKSYHEPCATTEVDAMSYNEPFDLSDTATKLNSELSGIPEDGGKSNNVPLGTIEVDAKSSSEPFGKTNHDAKSYSESFVTTNLDAKSSAEPTNHDAKSSCEPFGTTNHDTKSSSESIGTTWIKCKQLATVLTPLPSLHVQNTQKASNGTNVTPPFNSAANRNVQDQFDHRETADNNSCCYEACGSDSRVAERGIIKAEGKTPTKWQVDTGALFNATGNRNFFPQLTLVDGPSVVMGDGTVKKVVGTGTVVTGDVVLPKVYYVPGLPVNLVSVKQLAGLDYNIIFSRGVCYVRRASDGTLIGKANLGDDGMFLVDYLKVPL